MFRLYKYICYVMNIYYIYIQVIVCIALYPCSTYQMTLGQDYLIVPFTTQSAQYEALIFFFNSDFATYVSAIINKTKEEIAL